MFPSNFIKGTTLGIVSVKAGENIGVSMIRDLKGVIERERTAVGVFLTLGVGARSGLNPLTHP